MHHIICEVERIRQETIQFARHEEDGVDGFDGDVIHYKK